MLNYKDLMSLHHNILIWVKYCIFVKQITQTSVCMQAASRMDHLLPSTVADSARNAEKQRRRIAALAEFQEAALRHALQFPKLLRLVYSTCSVSI